MLLILFFFSFQLCKYKYKFNDDISFMQMQQVQRYSNKGSFCLCHRVLVAGSCKQYGAGKFVLAFNCSLKSLLHEKQWC